MALTSAERSALWRQRQRQNPMKHEEYKRKEKERYKKRKEKGQFLPVAELSTRDQRKLRRNWRINQRNKRQKDKKLQHDVSKILSPPNSPTSPEHHIIQQNQYESRKSAGRKKKNLNRSKVYREQFKLRIQLNNERRQKEKYKKRYFRLKKRICTDEMVSTVDKIIYKKEVRSALTLYTIMINNIKKRYRDCETSQEKRTIKNLIQFKSLK
ncbi:uncharacterized protein LOC132741080 [Ruditapes philippinarum]|uniref:uncharacterized protein LOC132741080 n=1 Tax=Ruditapes philippinarum TaxID=129788 RepID=UPI00295C0B0F|nr:uncharacterized protein LOC132741080 [Ruditapes philippinarum]